MRGLTRLLVMVVTIIVIITTFVGTLAYRTGRNEVRVNGVYVLYPSATEETVVCTDATQVRCVTKGYIDKLGVPASQVR